MLVPVPPYPQGLRMAWISSYREALSIKARSRDFHIEPALPAFEPLPSRSRPAPDLFLCPNPRSRPFILAHPRFNSLALE